MNALIIAGLLFALVLFFFYASYSIKSGVYLKALCRNPKMEKVVALTFDDGPDAIQTPRVLGILKKNNIKACFFCIGSKIAGNEDIIQRIKDEGHLLGNHSYSHSNKFPLYSSSKMTDDVVRCSIELEKITGSRVRLFRPPFGVTNPTVARVARRLGLTTVGWNIRTLDTWAKDSSKVVKRIEKKLSSGSVILLHDNLKASDTILEATIELIQSKGYRCVGVDELFNLSFET